MPLARLEIEIDNYCNMQVTIENRYGVRTTLTGDDAWTVYYQFAGERFQPKEEYTGTFEEIRQAYIKQLDKTSMSEGAKARRLGMSARGLRNARQRLKQKAKVHLAPKAQEEYENKALRATSNAVKDAA